MAVRGGAEHGRHEAAARVARLEVADRARPGVAHAGDVAPGGRERDPLGAGRGESRAADGVADLVRRGGEVERRSPLSGGRRRRRAREGDPLRPVPRLVAAAREAESREGAGGDVGRRRGSEGRERAVDRDESAGGGRRNGREAQHAAGRQGEREGGAVARGGVARGDGPSAAGRPLGRRVPPRRSDPVAVRRPFYVEPADGRNLFGRKRLRSRRGNSVGARGGDGGRVGRAGLEAREDERRRAGRVERLRPLDAVHGDRHRHGRAALAERGDRDGHRRARRRRGDGDRPELRRAADVGRPDDPREIGAGIGRRHGTPSGRDFVDFPRRVRHFARPKQDVARLHGDGDVLPLDGERIGAADGRPRAVRRGEGRNGAVVDMDAPERERELSGGARDGANGRSVGNGRVVAEIAGAKRRP